MEILNKLKMGRRMVMAGLLSTALVACDDVQVSSGGDNGPNVGSGEKVKIALLVPSGSNDGNQNQLARNLVNAANLAAAEDKSGRIEIRVYSTAGNAGTAAAAARSAVEDGAKIIVGPLFAEAANAVGVAVASKNVNVLSFSNNTEVAGGNVFVLGNSFKNTAQRLVGYASARGYKSVAVVSPQNTTGGVAAHAVRTAAAKSGANFKGVFGYPFTPEGIFSSSRQIASSINSSGTTAVVLAADSASGLPILAQTLPENGVNTSEVKLLGLSRWDIPPSNLSIRGLNGGWFAIPDTRAVSSFNSRYSNTYGSAPHPIAGVAYDGVKTVVQSIKNGGSSALRKSSLTRRSGFTGASGAYRLLSDGTTQRALSVAEVTSGAIKVISAAPKSFGGSGS